MIMKYQNQLTICGIADSLPYTGQNQYLIAIDRTA
jgi:hypothetical protein